jgi:hypothetical protein
MAGFESPRCYVVHPGHKMENRQASDSSSNSARAVVGKEATYPLQM